MACGGGLRNHGRVQRSVTPPPTPSYGGSSNHDLSTAKSTLRNVKKVKVLKIPKKCLEEKVDMEKVYVTLLARPVSPKKWRAGAKRGARNHNQPSGGRDYKILMNRASGLSSRGRSQAKQGASNK